MNIKSPKIVVPVIAIFILVAGLGLTMNYYGKKHPCSNAGRALGKCSTTEGGLEGTLQSVDCSRAGVGCTEQVLKLEDGETEPLSSQQDLKPYIGKKVRVTGQYKENAFGPGSPSVFEVESVQVLDQ